MPNRLALETSPYLLQHADNPVDWQAWGPEALAQSKREDRPILLSVGYSTCHWCHVMAHESFEDADVAALMNRHFVCIKVDREERPDIDQIYQTALQMLSQRGGGWPLTMFLAPDGTPFFGGTYFPRQARYNLPGFTQLLESVAHAWQNQRDDIVEQGVSLRAAMAESDAHAAAPGGFDAQPIRAAIAGIQQGFDPVYGGFSRAPKFPRPAELEFLFWSGDDDARRNVLFTLEKMARGGLMDQLGGGFFRYSTDERWSIPHFEKMLYDNGPLLALYADAWAQTGNALFARAAQGIVGWLQREMTTPEGLFYAALDADSEHEEGKFYVWTPERIQSLLTSEEYAVAHACWGLGTAPNFEDRAWHLEMLLELADAATQQGLPETEVVALLEAARAKLFAAREQRIRPGRDDKVLTSWNALMIKGLAHAGRRFDRADWIGLAQKAADALHRTVWRDGRLAASYQQGQARHNGYLDDYAFLLDALLELLQAEWRDADMIWARQLADALLLHFEDAEAGGFFFTSHDHEQLIHRAKPGYDNATPSGNGIAAYGLMRLGRLLDEARYQTAAERALGCFQSAMSDHPTPFPSLLRTLEGVLAPPRVIVLSGPEPELSAWKRAADKVVDGAGLLFKLTSDAREIPTSMQKTPQPSVNATICDNVRCLPEIVDLPELLAILVNRVLQ
ncbi:MAG: thioredoxin domain-containing protein [Hydrogenophilales bacterium 28-61-23]|nr:MAG: thioredoxin domain-containing protein [Hydrogenophilales bacterium 28-61-23]